MIKNIMFCLFVILSMGTVAADSVDLEIWVNSEGVYFVSVDGGGLQTCNDTICTIEIDNLTTYQSLSEGDMKYIAKYTSTQLEVDGFKTFESQSDNDINMSILRAELFDLIEEKQADNRAIITKTLIPDVEAYTELVRELEEKRGAIKTLDAQFSVHAETVKGLEGQIAMKDREIAIYHPIVIILFIWVGISLMGRSDLFRAIRERRER